MSRLSDTESHSDIEVEEFKRKLAEAWHNLQNVKIPFDLYCEFKLNMMLANLQLEAEQERDEIEQEGGVSDE